MRRGRSGRRLGPDLDFSEVGAMRSEFSCIDILESGGEGMVVGVQEESVARREAATNSNGERTLGEARAVSKKAGSRKTAS